MHITSIQNQCSWQQISFWLVCLLWKLSHFAVCLWPVILRGAEGEVAESILPKDNPRSPGEGYYRKQWMGPDKTLSPTPHPFGGYLFPREKIFLRLLKQWILQLQASPACRMTWRWGERLGQKTSSLKCAAQNGTKWTALVLSQRNESLKNQFT